MRFLILPPAAPVGGWGWGGGGHGGEGAAPRLVLERWQRLSDAGDGGSAGRAQVALSLSVEEKAPAVVDTEGGGVAGGDGGGRGGGGGSTMTAEIVDEGEWEWSGELRQV